MASPISQMPVFESQKKPLAQPEVQGVWQLPSRQKSAGAQSAFCTQPGGL